MLHVQSLSLAPAGTDHPLSPFLASGTATAVLSRRALVNGAIVPATPVVITLPLTDLSAPTEIVPEPVAVVLTAGTS
jgi:hypothetical protein